MELRKKYKDIDETLYYLGRQVNDSLDYAIAEVPEFENPEDLFYYMKSILIFRKDPPYTELLQSFPSMMNNNRHGIRGAGDCDCFVIAALASMYAQGWKDLVVILYGRRKSHPVHIACGIYWNGKLEVMDLTNPLYDMERPYKYRQILPV